MILEGLRGYGILVVTAHDTRECHLNHIKFHNTQGSRVSLKCHLCTRDVPMVSHLHYYLSPDRRGLGSRATSTQGTMTMRNALTPGDSETPEEQRPRARNGVPI